MSPLLSVLLLTSFTVAACVAADAPRPVEYRPAASLERLQHAYVDAPEVGIIRDFDLAGDRLYLLDRMDAVHVLERTRDGWAKVGEWGSRGAGPGEFRNASGLAVTPAGDVAVIEAERLQLFSHNGTVLGTFTTRLPCQMMLPGIASSGAGFMVYGNCMRRGLVTDTMKAVVAWTADTARYRIVAEEPRFTRDGTVGSMFSAPQALVPTADGSFLFGTGSNDCVTTLSAPAVAGVTYRARAPAASRRCGLVQTRYSAPPPPEITARIRAGGGPGRVALTWPDALPAYIDRVQAGSTLVLLRPFTADSLVLQAAEPGGRDIAVAPLNGFVACKAAGCLWILEDTRPMRIVLLEAGRIRELLGTNL
ncbi:hypothetical protein BH23GEM10_BH23GEM10_05400 [soil metagenome]